MRNSWLCASALALSVSIPAVALGQGQGQGQGRGNGHGQQAERGKQGGGERERGKQGRGNEGRADRPDNRGGGSPGRARQAGQERGGPQRADNPGRMRAVERGGPAIVAIPGRGRENDRGNGNRGDDDRPRVDNRGGERLAAPRRERNGPRLTQRRAVRLDGGEIARLRWQPERSIVRGCPPGLARKHNGCMPPGQARQIAQAQQSWYRNWWGYPAAANYIYDDGFLYRTGGDGRIADYVPLLGGSLRPGASWPNDYQAYPVDPYLVDYYGLDDRGDYRFADGAIFGVDPGGDQIIQTIVALIAGDDWGVGQRMPDGYGLYNVPYEYRDQYADGDDAMYRYSDGYVYEVDPTTQLVQAAIQLIS